MTFSEAFTIVLEMGLRVVGTSQVEEAMRCLLGRGAGQVQRGREQRRTAHPRKSKWPRKAGTGAKDIGLEVWETSWTHGFQG